MIIACPECKSPVAAGEPKTYELNDEAKNALAVKCNRCDCIFTVQVAVLKPGQRAKAKTIAERET